MYRLRTAFLAIGLLTVGLCATQLAADNGGVQITPAQRQRIKVLVAQFRNAKGDGQVRDSAISELLAIGGPAVEEIREALQKELRDKLQDYATQFKQRAGALYKKRTAQIDLQQVKELRHTVLSLQEQGGLTQEQILARGKPALEKLRELLVIPREMVLEDEAITALRKELLVLGQYRERIQQQELSDEQPAPPPEIDQRPRRIDDYLRGEEELVAQLAMPMSALNRKLLTANARLAAKIDIEEARCVMACNLMRNLLGLNVLALDLRLVGAARDHSADMNRLDFFGHESPLKGKAEFWDRAKRYRTTASGENIFVGAPDGHFVNQVWFESPGHHENMLAAHRRIGVGRSSGYFTQLFGD